MGHVCLITGAIPLAWLPPCSPSPSLFLEILIRGRPVYWRSAATMQDSIMGIKIINKKEPGYSPGEYTNRRPKNVKVTTAPATVTYTHLISISVTSDRPNLRMRHPNPTAECSFTPVMLRAGPHTCANASKRPFKLCRRSGCVNAGTKPASCPCSGLATIDTRLPIGEDLFRLLRNILYVP